MSHPLINHSPDLKHLQNEGYEVSIQDAHLLISGIPYVTTEKCIAFGTLVTEIDLSGQKTIKPSSHVVYFIGSAPCEIDGTKIKAIMHSDGDRRLSSRILINRSFSNKPKGGYTDYHHKMTRYIEIISSPAMALDPMISAKTFKVIAASEDDSAFTYIDTNSSRAHINLISSKLNNLKIGIIGLGGTGSYVLDLVAKTPVAKIHLFDGDLFFQHNAFRSPGAPQLDVLQSKMPKVEYFAQIYSNIHNGIHPHQGYLNESNLSMLSDLDFIFICIDRGTVRKQIFKFLEYLNKDFIDVGIGVQVVDERLLATVRVTSSTINKRDHVPDRVQFTDGKDDVYSTNIQIADLNMLNASLAVIKWKKQYGFYDDAEHENHTTYTTNCNLLLSEDPDA